MKEDEPKRGRAASSSPASSEARKRSDGEPEKKKKKRRSSSEPATELGEMRFSIQLSPAARFPAVPRPTMSSPSPPEEHSHLGTVVSRSQACAECRRLHSFCDRQTPCGRCVSVGLAHRCAPPPLRKRGRPRHSPVNSRRASSSPPVLLTPSATPAASCPASPSVASLPTSSSTASAAALPIVHPFPPPMMAEQLHKRGVNPDQASPPLRNSSSPPQLQTPSPPSMVVSTQPDVDEILHGLFRGEYRSPSPLPLVVQHGQEMFFVTDSAPAGDAFLPLIVHASTSLSQLLGYQQSDMMGLPLTEVLRPDLATWIDLHAQMRFRPSGQIGSTRSHTVAVVVRGALQALVCNIRTQFLHSMDGRSARLIMTVDRVFGVQTNLPKRLEELLLDPKTSAFFRSREPASESAEGFVSPTLPNFSQSPSSPSMASRAPSPHPSDPKSSVPLVRIHPQASPYAYMNWQGSILPSVQMILEQQASPDAQPSQAAMGDVSSSSSSSSSSSIAVLEESYPADSELERLVHQEDDWESKALSIAARRILPRDGDE